MRLLELAPSLGLKVRNARRVNDRIGLKLLNHRQIFVTRHNSIRLVCDGRGEDQVVVRIAANGYLQIGGDNEFRLPPATSSPLHRPSYNSATLVTSSAGRRTIWPEATRSEMPPGG